jgi:hypothetical protein
VMRAWSEARPYTPGEVFGARHSLRDGPAMIGPPVEAGAVGVVVVVVGTVVVVVEVVVEVVVVVRGGEVVVVVGGDVVVVVVGVVVVEVGGEVVVVVGGVPLPNFVGVVVVVVDVDLTGQCRRMTPESSRLPVSFANFIKIAVLTELALGPTNVEVADASTLIHAISRLALRPSANNLRVRWAVGA